MSNEGKIIIAILILLLIVVIDARIHQGSGGENLIITAKQVYDHPNAASDGLYGRTYK
jgi:hypothetical protein